MLTTVFPPVATFVTTLAAASAGILGVTFERPRGGKFICHLYDSSDTCAGSWGNGITQV